MKIISTNALIATLFLCSSFAALLIVATHSASKTYSSATFAYNEPPTYTAVAANARPTRPDRNLREVTARAIIPEASAKTTEEIVTDTEAKVTGLEETVQPEIFEATEFTTQHPTNLELEEPIKSTTVTEVATKPTTITTREVTEITPDTFEAAVITEVYRLTNKERSKKDLPILTLDQGLSNTAKQKAASMVQYDYFAHTDPFGCDFTCLLADTGYKALAWGENLMQYSGTRKPSAQTLAETTVKNWLKSSGHRENVLNPDYTHEGIAVVKTGNTYYVVSHYARPKID